MPSAPDVSHVPYPDCFVLILVIIFRNYACVPSILFDIDAERTEKFIVIKVLCFSIIYIRPISGGGQ